MSINIKELYIEYSSTGIFVGNVYNKYNIPYLLETNAIKAHKYQHYACIKAIEYYLINTNATIFRYNNYGYFIELIPTNMIFDKDTKKKTFIMINIDKKGQKQIAYLHIESYILFDTVIDPNGKQCIIDGNSFMIPYGNNYYYLGLDKEKTPYLPPSHTFKIDNYINKQSDDFKARNFIKQE